MAKHIKIMINMISAILLLLMIVSCENVNNANKEIVTEDTSSSQTTPLLILNSFTPDTLINDFTLKIIGKNFLKDTIFSVKIGEKEAIILNMSDDSITVRIPKLKSGRYKIRINSKSGIHEFNKLLAVAILDLNELIANSKSFSYNFKNLHVIKYYNSSYTQYPNPTSYYTKIDTSLNFCYNYNNKNLLIVSSDSISKIIIYENSYDRNRDTSSITFIIDKKSKNIIELNVYHRFYVQTHMYSEGYHTTQLQLKNVPYRLLNDSIVSIDLHGQEFNNLMTTFTYNTSEYYHERTTYSSYVDRIDEVLKSSDSTYINITIFQ